VLWIQKTESEEEGGGLGGGGRKSCKFKIQHVFGNVMKNFMALRLLKYSKKSLNMGKGYLYFLSKYL
jgi:hypothetical protein